MITKDSIEKIKTDIDFIASEDFGLFTPYLYLDGHRSGDDQADLTLSYQSGIDFYCRFCNIANILGIKYVVTLVNTKRNTIQLERINRLHEAIIQSKEKLTQLSNFVSHKIIGDYKNTQTQKMLVALGDNIISDSNDSSFFRSILLIDYSEEWSLNNLNIIKESIPKISSIIRFTRGNYNGGYIPLKLQESFFIYCQNPSISQFWTDAEILALILISFNNWSKLHNSIGSREYNENTKNEIRRIRDQQLYLKSIKLNLNIDYSKRIIEFTDFGPVIYTT